MQFTYSKERKHYTMYYPIVDCENEGDISSAEMEVVHAGGEIQCSYWDGNDCGDAYVLVHSDNLQELEQVRERLQCDCMIYL